MNYLVHVIDEASVHVKQSDGSYGMDFGQSEKGDVCQISRSDAFYSVDTEEGYIDAIVSIANIARIKGSDGRLIKLSDALSETKHRMENASMSDDDSVVLRDSFVEIGENTISNMLVASCQMKRGSSDDNWLELHKITFYAIEQNKVMKVQ